MLTKKNLLKINSYQPGKPIEEVKRSLGLNKIYKLASNEIPFYPSYLDKAILAELRNINRYPESSCFYLAKELVKKLKIKKDQLVFGNGSDELIVLAIKAFTDSESEVIVGTPTFLIYEIQAQIAGVKVKKIPLKNFEYDLNAMASAINKKTRLIFIANPDNPHGTYKSDFTVKRFLNKIPKDIIVFFDEAYFEFAPKRDFPKTIKFLKARGNIIITRTFSKAYGLAGLRVGYAISTPQICAILNKIREPFNVNRIAQIAACASLKSDTFLNKVLKHTEKEKEFLYSEFEKLGVEYIKSATNFILVNFGRDSKKLYDFLLKKGIIVREMSSWGLVNFFRVTVGLHIENIFFIKHLKEYLNK